MSRTLVPFLALSFISNLSVLVSPLFMMQVLDRVIPSSNMATLALLGGLALMALGLQALVDAARDLSLGRLSRWGERMGTALALAPSAKEQNQTIAQTSALSQFLTGPAAIAAFGLPWLPVFMGVLVLLHPAFLALLVALACLFALTSQIASILAHAARASIAQCSAAEQSLLKGATKAESTLGIHQIAQNLRLKFSDLQTRRHSHLTQSETHDVFRSASTGLLRNAGQISALALGAWLVTIDQLSAGGMIAGSIITSKSYGMVESALLHWRAIRVAHRDYQGLCSQQTNTADCIETIADCNGALSAENLIFPRGGGAPPRLDRVSFALVPGECLAIVGNSGSGKSTLLRALAGISPAPIGSVFYDENELRNLSNQARFELAGYLAQRADFNLGTIAENISCFEQNPPVEKIANAAKMAGVYGLIGALPDGFETDLQAQPYLLSAGQSQRLALARAIYAQPKYLFLDEPNALLDAEGERALGQTLLRLKMQGTTIVMVLHRSGIMGLADKVMQLENGRVTDFGKRTEVLHRLGIGGRQIEVPLLPSSRQDLEDWVGSYFTRATDQEFCQTAKHVSADLFQLACLHCPADTLRFAKFFFKFLDETHCEISMVEPAQTDVAKTLVQVQASSTNKDAGWAQPSEEHALLARINGQSSEFHITAKTSATHFSVQLSLSDATQTAPESQAI